MRERNPVDVKIERWRSSLPKSARFAVMICFWWRKGILYIWSAKGERGRQRREVVCSQDIRMVRDLVFHDILTIMFHDI